MLALYRLILLLTTPLWMAYLSWHPRTRGTLLPRLGLVTIPPECQNGTWIHAVSVGELQAATPLIEALKARNHPLLITTATKAAREVAGKRHGTSPCVFVTYMPVDVSPVIKAFLRKAKPQHLVIFETELWPNLLTHARDRGIKTYWLNARLSDRMLGQKGLVKGLQILAMNCFDLISPQSEEQLQRLRKLMEPGSALGPVGQTKLDVHPPSCPVEVKQLITSWKATGGTVIMLGSTHDPEEEVLLHLAMNQKLWENKCHVVVAPRHLEGVSRVVDLAKSMGFVTTLRSKIENAPPLTGDQKGCLVIDVTGELPSLYEVADIAFVGGSLVARGGHNVLEPAFWGVPVFVGPHTQNFTEAVLWLKSLGILVQEEKPELFERQWIDLFRNPERMQQWRRENREKMSLHQGVTDKHLELLLGKEKA